MKKIKYIISSLMIMLLTGCYPGEDFGINVSIQVDKVETGLCSGNVISSYLIYDGDPLVSEVGICWEEESSEVLPAVKKNSQKADNISSPYSIMIKDLKELTSYIVRPYMQVDGFYVYGDSRIFRTPSNSEFLPKLGQLQLLKAELDKLSVTSSITSVPAEYPVSEVGVCYTDQSTSNFTSGMSGVNTIKATLNDSKFTVDVAELNFSTTYRMRAYAKNQAGITYGSIEFFRTAGDEYVPKLGEVTITQNAPTFLEVSCTISEPLKTDSVRAWFEYTKSYNSTLTVEAKIKEGKMTARIADLQPSYNYSIVAKAENKFGISSSQHKNVTTNSGEKSKPTVSVPTITNITVDGAHAISKINITDSNYKALSGGFECSTSSYLHEGLATEGIIENDTILKLNLSELSDNTTYYIKAYINTDLGKVYSTATNFITAEKTPTISELNVKSILKTSVNLSAMVKPYDANSTITEAGVQYTMHSSINAGGPMVKGTIIGDSVFVDVADLTKGTEYKMRAYAVSGNKYYYGKVQNVTTKTDKDYAPSFTDVISTDITMTTMSLSSTFTLVDDTYKVKEAGFQYYRSTNINEITYGKLYIGDIKDGIITLSVSDLVSGSTYQIRPYMKFDDGTIYYGNVVSVKTKRIEDYIGDIKVSNILLHSANLEVKIEKLPANYEIVEAGFEYEEISGNYITKEKTWIVPIINNVIKLDIESLKQACTHRVRVYIKCGSVKYYGKFTTFETLSTTVLPSIFCNDITTVSSSSFSIEAEVKKNDELYPITEAGFLYIKSTSSSALTLNTNNAIRKPITIQNGKIKLSVNDLEKNSTYLVRAYVMSGNEVTYNEKTIRVYTNMDNYKPTMGTLTVEKTNDKYVASCKATVSQVFPVTDSGFVYSTSTYSPTLENNDGAVTAEMTESTFTEIMPFEKPQTGSTIYYVRAYAKNSNGTTYSSYKSVTISWND